MKGVLLEGWTPFLLVRSMLGLVMDMDADTDRQEEMTPEPETKRSEEQAMLYCPVCDEKLIARKCKLMCERCGYFMSCADYY